MNSEAFTAQKKALGHRLRRFYYYDGDALCSTIVVDFSDRTLAVDNHTENPIKTAFGNNFSPDWADFLAFLEERCVPRERAGLRYYLEAHGLDAYDPLEIIEKTAGRMAEDNQWLKTEDIA